MLTIQDVVAAAAEYIGREYKRGPMDCSELAQLVARALGLLRKTEPDRTADGLMHTDAAGVHFAPARPLHPGETPPPGSWLFIVDDATKTPLHASHMGVALGTGQLVQASSRRKVVRFDDLWSGPTVFVRVARV